MYVPFDNQSISILNRIADVVGLTGSYNYGSISANGMTPSLWHYASVRVDDAADTDIVFEEHPIVDRIYSEVIVKLPHWDDPKSGDKKHPLWDVYDAACVESLALENRIWLAICVANAYLSLAGEVSLVWQLNDGDKTQKVIDEFKDERNQVNDHIRELFAIWMGTVENKSDPTRGEVGMLLLKSDKDLIRDQKLKRMPTTGVRALNLDYDLNEINPGSLVRHIKAGWEGIAIRKAEGDGILVNRRDSRHKYDVVVIADELAVITDDPK